MTSPFDDLDFLNSNNPDLQLKLALTHAKQLREVITELQTENKTLQEQLTQAWQDNVEIMDQHAIKLQTFNWLQSRNALLQKFIGDLTLLRDPEEIKETLSDGISNISDGISNIPEEIPYEGER